MLWSIYSCRESLYVLKFDFSRFTISLWFEPLWRSYCNVLFTNRSIMWYVVFYSFYHGVVWCPLQIYSYGRVVRSFKKVRVLIVGEHMVDIHRQIIFRERGFAMIIDVYIHRYQAVNADNSLSLFPPWD
jgi:hypothetical protein